MFSPLARFLSLNQLLSVFPFIVMVTGEVAIRHVAGNARVRPMRVPRSISPGPTAEPGSSAEINFGADLLFSFRTPLFRRVL